MQRTVTLALLVFTVVSTAVSQPLDTLKKIDQLFSSWNNDTPGGAVMVTRGQELVYNKAFGLADLEHDVPNRTTTVFECGSVSKQFTAMATLLLVKQGELSLQDDVRKYIPELPVYKPAVRIQHLLNHTSGLKDWGSIGSISGWPRTSKVYTQDLALQIICHQPTLNFPPGAQYSYSNSNFTLLAFIVERVSGQTLSQFSKEKLFAPAGMVDTRWRSDFREVIPNRSIAYQKTDQYYEQLMPFEHTHGHGGLLTTTADLTKWNQLLETHAIGGDDVYRWRTTRGILNNGAVIGYGAGLSVGTFNGTEEISHSGATAGYRGWLAYYPEKKISITIISNDGSFNAPAAGRAIAGLYFGKSPVSEKKKSSTKITADQTSRWTGLYRSIREFNTISIEAKGTDLSLDGKLLEVIHRDTLQLDQTNWIAVAPGRLMSKNRYDTLTYVQVASSDASSKTQGSLAGVYISEEAETTWRIELRDNKLWIDRKPMRDLALEPRFKDGFLIDDEDLVEFKRNRSGVVTGLELSISRAQRIKFTRKAEK